jgi:hypothetical protein
MNLFNLRSGQNFKTMHSHCPFGKILEVVLYRVS